jgi:hypothetical protein
MDRGTRRVAVEYRANVYQKEILARESSSSSTRRFLTSEPMAAALCLKTMGLKTVVVVANKRQSRQRGENLRSI